MDALAALIDDALASGLGSAAAISVGDRGREVYRLVRGTTQRVPSLGAPVTEHTPFDLASLTKPMSTAAIAMALVSDGALDLDTPIRHWFPDAASTGTVRHLLGHAAGCAAHVEFFRTLRVGTHPDPYAELITLAARHPASPPGVATVYSDLGYILLGAILERVAALPLADAFRTLVAEPLGLTASTFPGTVPRPASVATELDDRGLVCGLVHDENAYFAGGICGHAGLFAPITDVARFAAAIVSAYADSPLSAPIPGTAPPSSAPVASAPATAPVASAPTSHPVFTPVSHPGTAPASALPTSTLVNAPLASTPTSHLAFPPGLQSGTAPAAAIPMLVTAPVAWTLPTSTPPPNATSSRFSNPFRADVVRHFLSTSAAPATTWRLGWDCPSLSPGISHAGDLWPRTGSVGHTGFTGTSLWLDLAQGRWLALLTNRVHPSRHTSADGIKSLRRALADVVASLDA